MVLPLHRLSSFSVLCMRCSVGVFPLSLGQNSLHGVTSDVQHLAFITSSQLTLQSLVLHMHNTSIDQGSSGNPNRNFWFLARKQPLYLSALPWKPGGIQDNEVPTGKSWEKENTLTLVFLTVSSYDEDLKAICLISPCFSFICKMGMIAVTLIGLYWGLNEIIHVKYLEQCLACSGYHVRIICFFRPGPTELIYGSSTQWKPLEFKASWWKRNILGPFPELHEKLFGLSIDQEGNHTHSRRNHSRE